MSLVEIILIAVIGLIIVVGIGFSVYEISKIWREFLLEQRQKGEAKKSIIKKISKVLINILLNTLLKILFVILDMLWISIWSSLFALQIWVFLIDYDKGFVEVKIFNILVVLLVARFALILGMPSKLYRKISKQDSVLF